MQDTGLTILMVEDDESIRNLLEMELEECGHRVLSCGTVAEADRVIAERLQDIDVCVFDIRLPDGDGFSLLGRIRDLKPQAPVVFMTGHGNKPTVIQALKNGAYDYIEKPFSVSNDLLPIVARAGEKVRLEKKNGELGRQIRTLFDGLVRAAVAAIESRDPKTRGHSERVAAFAVRLAEAVAATREGRFADVTFAPSALDEIRYAALLHDVGKIAVRERVLNKEHRLHPEQLLRLRARLEALQLRIHIHLLDALAKGVPGLSLAEVNERVEEFRTHMAELWDTIQHLNETEEMSPEDAAALQEFVEMRLDVGNGLEPVLLAEEVEVLSVSKGSLTAAERAEVETHVEHSFRFVNHIPWTRDLARVPELVHQHHELLDGSGYPLHLTGSGILLAAQILTVADIYDSLVAVDRPYRKAVSHERAVEMLRSEVARGRIDGDLLEIFLAGRVWESAPITADAVVA